jgi:hypothetical protein
MQLLDPTKIISNGPAVAREPAVATLRGTVRLAPRRAHEVRLFDWLAHRIRNGVLTSTNLVLQYWYGTS